ncbi:MAG TPA: SWIM zinc finger family protein, partial [Rhodanobacter sp.]|nr:SWIM zinc finger family protein [Rhodanobacter sp.]
MLDDLISRASLEGLAGSSAFRRGEEYLAVGAVGRLRITGDKVAAKVEGTTTYRVELRDDDGALAFDCSCPRAADGYFCKHGVALGLAWLDQPVAERKAGTASGRKKRRDPWRDIKQYLTKQPAETLIELLLDVAQRDDRLYQSLLLKAERAGGGRGNVATAFRRAIDEATRIHGFVDWREAGSFASDVEQVAESMAELLKPDTAALLVELAEYAIERLEKSMQQIDDSNGEVGGIVHGLGELHLQACTMAAPAPAALAERLFALETTLPFGVWSFDVLTYRDVLGAEGLRRYRELADAQWRKLKPRDAKDTFDTSRFTITRIMERLAEASGDVDELVAIKSRDLSSGYHYLEIAEIWAKARQPAKALEWAERGLQAFPDRPDNRLRDFLVAAYLKRKRHDEALQLTWIQFEEQPALGHYQKLHDVAGQLGRWPEQRERALARVAGE